MKQIIYKALSLAFILPACDTDHSNKNTKTKEETTQEKLHVLFIAADDLKPMLACYGDTSIRTPNIDQLAKRGMVFHNNHCQVAVCGASRASLLTGMYADKTKVWTFDTIRKYNPDVLTLPQHFKNNGYTTVNLGKIYDYRTVDTFSDSISWDYAFPVTEDDYYPHYNKKTGIAALYHYQSEYVKEKYRQYKEEALVAGKDTFRYAFQRISPATECLDVPDDAYKDGIFAKLAVEQINKLAVKQNPFFLAVGFHKPHLPFVAPKKYWDMYDRDKIPVADYQKHAKNAVEYAHHTSGELRNYTDEKGNPVYDKLKKGQKLNTAEQKKLIHAYMATVSFVDAQVGKVLDALEKHGIADNTIIVFWGDHGWHLGDHNMWGKVSNFEQATRSPLIISGPGIQHRDVQKASEFVDIYPTMCELAGLDIPSHLDGSSLLKINEGTYRNAYAISQWPKQNKMGYAIRDDRFRYVEWVQEGFHANTDADVTQVADIQLFDYEKDPLETINVAGQKEYEQIQMMMKKKLTGFYRKQGLLPEKYK
jgi:iduronate 2-sulfatase